MASIKQRGASQDAMSARYVWMPVCMLLVQLMMSLPGASAISIEKFGAVPFENSQEAATNNSEALKKALLWSNSSSTDRTVQIPAGKNYVVFNTTVQSLYNVNLQIDGNLTMVSNISWWPYKGERPENFAMLTILDSQHMKIGGDGVVDGKSYAIFIFIFLRHVDLFPQGKAMIGGGQSSCSTLFRDRTCLSPTGALISKYMGSRPKTPQSIILDSMESKDSTFTISKSWWTSLNKKR